jgi:acyl carrier protein
MTDTHTTAIAGTSARPHVVTAIIEGLREVLHRDLERISVETSLITELGLDSTSVLDLLMTLEERLDFEFDTEDLNMAHFASVATLAEFVDAELES